MLDSLVRVSRRVGWKADQFATDPKRETPASPGRRGGAVGGHGCPVPTSRTPPDGRVASKADAVVPRSRGRLACRGCNSANVAARAYLPRRLVAAPRPVVALCPRKVHTAGPGEAPRPGREDPEPQRPGPRAELSSAGRLCGSTRLPLSGFTYS